MRIVAHASPPDESVRRDRLVQKVADLLHSRHADTLEGVLHIAAIPPRDVAAAFGDHGALFIAVVTRIADGMLAPLAERPTDASFRQQLVRFARGATDVYSGLQLRNLYRIALTDGAHAIRVDFYRHGPARVRDELARFIRAAQSPARGSQLDSRRAAAHFLALLRAYWDLADVSAVDERPHVDDDLGWLVEVFLTGIETGTHDAHLAHPARN